MINRVSQVEFVDGASDFRLLSRPMVDAILSLPENNRFQREFFLGRISYILYGL